MNTLMKRHTIETLFQLKIKALQTIETIESEHVTLKRTMEEIDGFLPFYLDDKTHIHSENRNLKYIEQQIWRYLVRLYELDKFMLCTEYEKLMTDIDSCRFPDFTIENAQGWINQLQEMIFNNVLYMSEKVYNSIVNDVYYTGSSYSTREKKKRNNKGIDSFFILTTSDYGMMFSYWHDKPTVTDDLEKLCYILDGKKIPKHTLKDKARSEKLTEIENDYFSVKFCQNGNTHYRIKPDTLQRLNSICPDGSAIGEDIKIKVFESFYN